MVDWLKIDDERDPDVAAIMRQIQRHVARYREEDILNEIQGQLGVELSGRLDPSIYAALATALREQSGSVVSLDVRRSSLPVVGGLVDAVRGKVHRLALFYVNRHAAAHAAVEVELLRTLALALQTTERFESEVNDLRAELAELRKRDE